MSATPLISVRNLTKRYGGVVALADMNLEVERGTIHAVVGENGAGKSTLMKVLAGSVRPDSGDILIEGAAGHRSTRRPPRAGKASASSTRSSASFPERSVLANLFVNREPTRRGLISLRAMEDDSRAMLDRLGLHVDVRAPLKRLSIGERQLVELCRVLLEEPRLLILDEPNSALNRRETERLFTVLQGLRARGITMLYVSHRLEEVFSISDRVTVTRNGRDVLARPTAELTIPEVIEAMIGQQREALFPPPLPPRAGIAERRIEVRDLAGGRLDHVSFTARSGEVVGLAGLEGSGVTDILELLFGMRRADSGSVTFPDGSGLPKSPTDAARRRVCLVPADRRRNGLMLDKPILFNIANVAVGARDDGPLWFLPRQARGTGAAADRRAAHQGRVGVVARQFAVRRQPAEGGDRQVAGDRAATCSCSTIRRAASTSAPSGRSTA